MDDVPDILKLQDAVLVQTDTPCRRCSYNVRGLKQDGRCPECGAPVGVSTLGDFLRFSDPSWLGKLSLGLSFILIEIVIGITAFGISLFMYPGVWRGWMTLAASAIGMCGVWLVTSADPSGLGEAQYAVSRKFVRVALAVEVGLQGFAVIAVSLIPILLGASPLVALSIVAAELVGAAGEFAKFIYLRKLAMRIPHRSLAYCARFLQWSYPLLMALSSVIFSMLFSSSGGRSVSGLASVYGSLSLMRPVIFIVMMLFFLSMRRTIGEQLKCSRQVWTDAGAMDGGRAA